MTKEQKFRERNRLQKIHNECLRTKQNLTEKIDMLERDVFNESLGFDDDANM